MVQTRLILASSSPRRQELVRTLGLPVEVMPSDANEQVEDGWSPDTIVEQLSLRKARAVQERLSSSRAGLIVGSDTIVVMGGRVLGKPRDRSDAEAMLSALQGRVHEVFTGLALVHTGALKEIVKHSVSRVTFRPMSADEIRAYVNTGEPMDKAGAYGVQGLGSVFIERIEGDFYSVMGLPLNLLYQMLLEFGVNPLKNSRTLSP